MENKIMGSKRFAKRYAIILIALGGGLIYLLCLHATVVGHDESAYVMLARSIATGQGFRDLHLPGIPPSTLRPFGYPLLLVPATLLFPEFPGNVIPLKLVSVFFGVANILVVYWLYRSLKLETWLALLLTAVMALTPLTLVFATRTLSEASYLFFSLVALLLLGRWEEGGYRRSATWLLAVLAMAMAYFIRTVGFSIFVAALGYLLLRRQWKRAVATGLLFALLISPWVYRNVTVGTSGVATDYLANVFWLKDMQRPYLGTVGPADLIARLLNNVRGHATETILWLLVPWAINGWWPAFLSRVHLESLAWVPAALGLTVSGFCVLGYLASLKQKLRVDHLYVVLYLGIILLPPWYAERNLWPLLPFLLYYIAVGLRWLIEKATLLRPRSASLAGPVAIVVLCIILFGFAMSDRHLLATGAAYRAAHVDGAEQAFLEMCEWIRENAADEDLVMYLYPVKTYLHTGYKTVGIPMIIDRGAFLGHLYGTGVDYVALQPSRQEYSYGGQEHIYLQPALTGYPSAFSPVCRTPSEPRIVVYEVVR